VGAGDWLFLADLVFLLLLFFSFFRRALLADLPPFGALRLLRRRRSWWRRPERHGWDGMGRDGRAGVRAELERSAALHLRLAARRHIAQGARLPLPR